MTTYNPADYTVDQVNEYLDEHPEETGAVMTAEAEGEGRVGILHGPHGTEEPAQDSSGTDPQGDPTEAVTGGQANPTGTPEGIDVSAAELAEAQAVAVSGEGETSVTDVDDVQERGYFGTSPQREATGLDDKGLSQESVLGDNAGEAHTYDQGITRDDTAARTSQE